MFQHGRRIIKQCILLNNNVQRKIYTNNKNNNKFLHQQQQLFMKYNSNNNNRNTATSFHHVFFSTTTSGGGGGSGDDDDEKDDISDSNDNNNNNNIKKSSANPIFDLAREELKKKENEKLIKDEDDSNMTNDLDIDKPFDIHEFEAEMKRQEEEEELAEKNSNNRNFRRGVKREQNEDLSENYDTLRKMLNIAVRVGISPYDVKKEFELQYHRLVNENEAILISKCWRQFKVNEKQMKKLQTYAMEKRNEIAFKDRRAVWGTSIMTPDEMEEEKQTSLKSLVRDFTSLDTKNELKMLQSPELFFHHDNEFENEDMNIEDDIMDDPELKLVGGNLVRGEVHDTLLAATERTLALEALTQKPVTPTRYQSSSWLMQGISRGRGSRKSSTAAAALCKGDGKITVNKRPLADYFKRTSHRNIILSPFVVTETIGKFDVEATCQGGGISGQAQSLRMAIARAIQEIDPALRPPMKKQGYLTRDPRKVERKKPGRAKARKRYQWVKR